MQPYQVILLVLMLIVFAYIAAFLYVFSHANDFSIGIKRKSDSLSVLLTEKTLALSNIDRLFKNSGVVYSNSQDKAVAEMNNIKLDHPNYEELIKSISSIKNVEGVLSSLSIDNQWVLVDENIGIEKDRVIDLDRNLRAGIALYNADVIAYNYWLSIPGYRLAMCLIGYKKKKVIS